VKGANLPTAVLGGAGEAGTAAGTTVIERKFGNESFGNQQR
jgi:hypothetical protein